MNFHTFCRQENILSLPTFSHMLQRGTIYMDNYRMDRKLLRAFCKFVIDSYTSGLGNFSERSANINTVVIKNCRLDDTQVSSVVKILEKFRDP